MDESLDNLDDARDRLVELAIEFGPRLFVALRHLLTRVVHALVLHNYGSIRQRLADSSVTVSVRPWVNVGDYGPDARACP